MTELNRYQLMQKLQVVEPALADNELVPVLKHFMFTGKRLMAYNDRIAISVPLESEFKGALTGAQLSQAVKTVKHSKNITLTADNNRAKFTAGKSRLLIPMMPANAFLFEMPAVPGRDEGVIGERDNGLFTAIENLLASVSGYSITTDQLGITLMPDGAQFVRMFSTNSRVLSYSRQKLPQLRLQRRVLLPAEFCEAVLRLRKEADKKQLVIRRDHVMFVADKTILFGRLLTPDAPVNFEQIMETHMPQNFPRGMAKLDRDGKQRDRLKTALELSKLIADIKGNEVPTVLEVTGNVMKFHSVSERGEHRDEVKVDAHPAIKVKINASLILEGYDKYNDILFTHNCAVLARGSDNVCLVAAFGG